MPAEFSADIKETVRSRTDLVALIGESRGVQARRGGREFVCLCPFHDDHNPSLTINPERQSYKCWSCQEGGDCFSWVMKLQGVGFREALEFLANRAGVPLPKHPHREKSENGPSKKGLLSALSWAQEQFHETLLKLPGAQPARDYLSGRGFTPQTIAEFRIGFHPNNREWLLDRATGKFSRQELLDARLVGEREDGSGNYDYFVDRIVFPIWNEQGQPVAFGGRVMPGSTHPAKYWNSPESPLFEKSKLLFAIHKSREAIRKSGVAIVVEGYADCIMAHQFGITNAVGTLGTALTDQHVQGLKRFTNTVVLVYDGDAAGRNAALRSLPRFIARDIDLRILVPPDDLDPDDFLRQHGKLAFEELVRNAPEAWEFKYQATRSQYSSLTLDAQHRILEEMLGLLAQAPASATLIREQLYLNRLADRLGLPEEQIRKRYQELRRQTKAAPIAPAAKSVDRPSVAESLDKILKGKLSAGEQLECDLLEALVTSPQLLKMVRKELTPDDLQIRQVRDLYVCLCEIADSSRTPSSDVLLAELEEPEQKRLAVWIDSRAQAKSLTQKLAAEGNDSSILPPLVRKILDELTWKKREVRHREAVGKLRDQIGNSQELDPGTEALLKEVMEFHQQRAAVRK